MSKRSWFTEDKQQCGKRAVAIAAAIKRAKPDFPQGWPSPAYAAAKTTWEACAIECMKAFDASNLYFPKKYFLHLCGFENSLTKDIYDT